MIRMTHGACTHIGQVRRDNEDSYVAIDGLYVVADGMGGHSAGEVASAIAVSTLKDAYTATNPGLHSPEQVAEAVALANTAVFVEALDDSAKSGMGTTLTALVVTERDHHEVVIANVGDSRTYLWRNGFLQQITKDHSHVQTLVDRGAISQIEARTHYQRNIVLRAVGIDAEVQVDLFPLTVQDGDRFILCSDGLVDEANDDEIVSEIRLRSTPQQLAEHLVQLANDNGGRDNITVVVVDFTVTESPVLGSATDNSDDMTSSEKSPSETVIPGTVPSTTVTSTTVTSAASSASHPATPPPQTRRRRTLSAIRSRISRSAAVRRLATLVPGRAKVTVVTITAIVTSIIAVVVAVVVAVILIV